MADKNEIKVPDIGGATKVDVIEVLVKVGDHIDDNTSLITLESDKASMEIPASATGTVLSLNVKVGDKVSEGDVILTIETEAGAPPADKAEKQPQREASAETNPEQNDKVAKKEEKIAESPSKTSSEPEPLPSKDAETSPAISAGPAVRRMARELGIDLALVKGSGRKSRINKEDIALYVKTKLQERSSGGISIGLAPTIDFTKFGEIDTKPLNKIKRLTGTNVHRAWVTIPHVTQFDEVDITQLEHFRKSEVESAKAQGIKLTLLAFVCKVVYKALVAFPQFNASLDASGEQLIYKKYYNIGIAVETPNGLVVPVIKKVDQLSIGEIAKEMGRLSSQAREKGLMPNDMNGGCFTISSLGGIGGTAFTPIVNSPEVAILGLSKAVIKPVYQENDFEPRLMLPLSLSYDHRVIDGAEAARFTRFLSEHLSDIRRILL